LRGETAFAESMDGPQFDASDLPPIGASKWPTGNSQIKVEVGTPLPNQSSIVTFRCGDMHRSTESQNV